MDVTLEKLRSLSYAFLHGPRAPQLTKQLKDAIKSTHLKTLLSFELQHPEYSQILTDEVFADTWRNKLKSFAPLAKNQDYRFDLQANANARELLLGYLCYARKNTPELDHQQRLQHGLSLHSFHCFNKLINLKINAMINQENQEEQAVAQQALVEFLHAHEHLAHFHQTPGLLAFANGYCLIAFQFIKNHDPERAKIAMIEALSYLHQARALEKGSVNAIHNAYFGRGLTLSNALQIDSIEGMISRLVSQGLLSFAEIDRAKAQAHKALQNPPQNQATPQKPAPTHYKDMALDRVDEHGNTPMHLAYLCDDLDYCKILSKQDPSLAKAQNNKGLTPRQFKQQCQDGPSHPRKNLSPRARSNHTNNLFKAIKATTPANNTSLTPLKQTVST